MLGIIKTVLKLLELFLRLKVRSFYRDLFKEQKESERNAIREIEQLRASMSSQNAIKADILLAHMLKDRKTFNEIVKLYENEQTENITSSTERD